MSTALNRLPKQPEETCPPTLNANILGKRLPHPENTHQYLDILNYSLRIYEDALEARQARGAKTGWSNQCAT
eukprot:2328551-Amphidinium_carterae.2